MTAGSEASRIAELEEDNRRLRRLLDQRNAPGELRHRLRSTVALLRAIVHRSAETGRDLPGYVAHLEDRLDAVTRAQALADQHGEVSLPMLLVDELFRYGMSEGERFLLSGPEVLFQPRAGQVFGLAVHELAVNAVEYGVLGSGSGRIEVAWTVASTGPNAALLFTWTEFAPGTQTRPVRGGFGTEVLTRMLAYELKAETQLDHPPGGVRCTIRLPVFSELGRVAPS